MLTWNFFFRHPQIASVRGQTRMRQTGSRILLVLLMIILSATPSLIAWHFRSSIASHFRFDAEHAVVTWAYPDRCTGIENEETARFLAWGNLKSFQFCRVDMNRAGETIVVTTDISWCATDDEIQTISNISTLNKVVFRADFATDQALDYLTANLQLKEIQTIGKKNGFTARGLRDFHRRRPDVTFNL